MKTPKFPATIEPLTDPRWDDLVGSQPLASIFHHPAWLRALQRTYGFTPLAFTTADAGEPLRDGLVFCPLQSWLTGKRLVSLPFSDHCDAIADSDEARTRLFGQLASALHSNFEYAEVRSTTVARDNLNSYWQPSHRFLWHTLSLEPDFDAIFRGFHKNSIQRKIKRAEREKLQYQTGNSDTLLDHFYTLLIRTRRRHRLPPQPFRWFRNLRDSMGDRMRVHVAFHDGIPATAILTLSHQRTLTYKYGCSDERMNPLGGMPFLLWRAIQQAKSAGLTRLDLGRTEATNEGLKTFKDHLGATSSPLTYWIYQANSNQPLHRHNYLEAAQRFIPPLPETLLRLPRAILSLPGTLLYPHMD